MYMDIPRSISCQVASYSAVSKSLFVYSCIAYIQQLVPGDSSVDLSF
jgi:hypothetical protein